MKKLRLLAVASAGGHWVQLRRMLPAFGDCTIHWVSTAPSLSSNIPVGGFTAVNDASMWDKKGLLVMAAQIAWKVMIFRPDVVVTTGAAPGFFAIVFARLIGAKTIWVDSIANAEELSLAGKKAKRWATHWLTQWPDLAKDGGPDYIGAVI